MLILTLVVAGIGCGGVTQAGDGDGDGDSDAGDGDGDADAAPSCVTSILFTSSGELTRVDPDGSNPVGLGVTGFELSWSSDGSRIAMLSNDGGAGTQIVIVNADGSDATPVGDDTGMSSPRWSPDDSRFAYQLPIPGAGTAFGDLVVINADGSGRATLKPGTAAPLTGTLSNNSIAWSPDGERIVYAFFDGDITALRVIGADGAGDAPLTPAGEIGRAPRWSPDGDTIAFENDDDILAIPATGGASVNLTSNIDDKPQLLDWTPSDRILFRVRDDIFLMDRDGTDQTNLTQTAELFEVDSEIAPDESALAMTVTTPEGGREDPNLYIAGPDGSNPTPVTTDDQSGEPRWQPCQ
jgi:Tol biopolymer transport system component